MPEHISEIETIYIPLLNEGVDAWRPVQGKKIDTLLYRIESENADPDDEEWKFSTGSLVRCEKKVLSGGEKIVAVERVS